MWRVGPSRNIAKKPMPIIELSRIDSPLTQGDILSGVPLFVTREGSAEKEGESVKSTAKLCLVLSRPCVTAHKKQVVVAAVEKYPDNTPRSLDSFDKVLAFLTGLRDGGWSPDLFYLGQLPEHTGRYCARLDALFTIEIPADDKARQAFLTERRILTLHPDFARDLHLRLFNAFASLGFDDHAWPSTEDLQWLVAQGQADIAAAELALQQQQALQAPRDVDGTQFRENELTAAQRRRDNLVERVAPYKHELNRRQGLPPTGQA
jgi:hypothetical protein